MWVWLLSIAGAWGIFLYCVLAMMGAGSADNLRGRRLRLFLACLFWPATLLVLIALVVFNLVRPKKKRVSLLGRVLGGPSGPTKQNLLAG
ncbi:hypothetical protein IHQ71_10670 [Rhizobium sp. TH2]|uniref:hypothetical protein n=1 Tax=Rhizobium sp. TH2 TaxID=2775403 RepID=UPI002158910D|nr:hypothetical protein [Rhizobium sp. TH2]UVC10997.1 hypothetical protein IHQ71_10670 [Rhizobium sp. TH2]